MDLYHTTDCEGISELNPTAEKMRELLDSLDAQGAHEAELLGELAELEVPVCDRFSGDPRPA